MGSKMRTQRDAFIEQEKRNRRRITETVSRCYAAFTLAVCDMGLIDESDEDRAFETLVELFSKTQDYFYDAIKPGGVDIIEQCFERTGINMMSELTAKEANITEGTKV